MNGRMRQGVVQVVVEVAAATAIVTAVVIAAVTASCTLVACKDTRRDKPQPRPRSQQRSDASLRPGHAALIPKWTLTVPGTPGQRLVENASGPLLVASDRSIAVVGSSVIGFAGINVTTGSVVWQRRDETRPGPAVLYRGLHRGLHRSQLWLPGRCDAAQRPPTTSTMHVVGCITVVEPTTGAMVRRMWISLPRAMAGASPKTPRGMLGLTDTGLVLWRTGHDVWAIDATSGTALSVCGGSSRDSGPIRGVTTHSNSVYVLWSDAIGLCSFTAHARGRIAPTWRKPLSERIAAGSAGPIVVADHVVWVRDETLEARRLDGRHAWRAKGRFAHCPTCLTATNVVQAIRLDAAVTNGRSRLGLATVAPATGTSGAVTGVIAAPLVLAASGHALLVRADTSLRNDWVRTINAALVAGPAWQLPAPTSRRTGHVGLVGLAKAVLVYYDGRHLVRLPIAGPRPSH